MYLICRPLYGLSYSWWSGDGVLVGAWCTVTKGGGVGWGRDIDQNLPWHQPLPPSYSIQHTLLSISPSLFLSLSLSLSLARSLARSLGLPSLTHTFLPSSPSRYTRPSVASGSQCRIRNGKRFSLANQTNHFYVLAGDVSHERCCRCIEIM